MPDEPAPSPAPTSSPVVEAAPAAPRRGLGEGRSTQAKNPLPFVLLVIVLCVAGWFIVSWMADTTSIQDCVMSGRKNCAPLEVDPVGR